MAWLIALALQAGAAGTVHECQAALGPLYEGADVAAVGQQVDGKTIAGSAGLAQLRSRTGDRLLVVNGGAFAGADLRQAKLKNICFVGTDFSRTDWRGVSAPGLGFIDTNLEGARLAGARMPRVLLRQANLKDVEAVDADFSGVKMDGGWDGSVDNLRLERANLRGFRFDCGITIGDGCPLEGEMSLQAADLTGASLATYSRYSSLIGARIDRTELGLSQLIDLDAAELAGPLRLRGGDTVVEISPAEFRTLRPHLRLGEPLRPVSFNCAAARTPPERAICGPDNGHLADLDGQAAELYRLARAASPSVAAEQQAWLRRRDACGADADCLIARYEERIDALYGRAGRPEWLRPGVTALFVQPDVHFASAFRSHPLFARILPVLIDGASGRLLVRVNANGTIDADGDAIGGNAHLCSLGAEGLSLDRSNGWYSGPYEGDADTPAALRGRPMPVLRFLGDVAQVYRNGQGGVEGSPDPRGSDYASCGARASFGDLVRVPVTEAEAAELLRDYRQRD